MYTIPVKNLKVGDVIVVKDIIDPRVIWKRTVENIEDVHKDGKMKRQVNSYDWGRWFDIDETVTIEEARCYV